MAIQSLGLGITLSGKDQISGVLSGVGANLGRLQSRTQKFAKVAKIGFAGVGAGIGILAGVGALATPFGQFEQGIARVGAISQATEPDLKRLAAAAKQAGIDTQFSPTEATEGLANLAQAGFDATDSISLLTPVLDLAAGGQIGLAQSSATVTAAVKAFGLQGEEAIGVADKLLKISNITALSANDLQLALGNVARGAGATGQALDEMLPAIGLVKDTGVDASVAASSVSSALLMMAKNAAKFKGVGVEVTDAQGKFRPFLDVVQETSVALGEKFPNQAKRAAKMTELFGRFGLTAANAIGNQLAKGIKVAGVEGLKGADAIGALRDAMAGATGTAAKFRDALLDTLEGQKTLLKGSIETLAIVAGEPFAKAMKPMVSQAIEAVNRLIVWIEKLDPKTKSTIASFIIGAGVFIAVAGAIVAAVGAIGFLVSALGGSAIAWLAAGTVATGAGAAIAGGADSGSAATESFGIVLWGLKQIADQVFTTLKNFWEGVKAGFSAAMEEAQPAIDTFFIALTLLGVKLGEVDADLESATTTGRTLGSVLGKIAEFAIIAATMAIFMGNAILDAWNDAEGVLSPVTDAFSDLIDEIDRAITEVGELGSEVDGSSSAWQTLGGAIVWVVGLLARVVGPLIKGIGGIIASLAWIFGGVINIIAGLIEGDWSRVWLGVKEIVFGVVKAIISLIFGLAEAVGGVIDSLLEAAGKKPKNVAKKVALMKTALQGELQKGLGLEVKLKPKLTAAPDITRVGAAGRPGPDLPFFERFPAPGQPGALPIPSLSQLPAAGPPVDVTAAATTAAVAAAKALPGKLISKAQVIVDGQVLADIVTTYDKDGSERAAADVSAG